MWNLPNVNEYWQGYICIYSSQRKHINESKIFFFSKRRQTWRIVEVHSFHENQFIIFDDFGHCFYKSKSKWISIWVVIIILLMSYYRFYYMPFDYVFTLILIIYYSFAINCSNYELWKKIWFILMRCSRGDTGAYINMTLRAVAFLLWTFQQKTCCNQMWMT